MDINLQVSRQLEEVISESFWDIIRGPDTPLCAICGATASTKTEFYKFAYLPEVLMFSTSYVRDSGTGVSGSAWANVPEAQLTYPETLDMSNLRDDPDGRAADRNCLYRLQSIVVAPNQATPMWVRGGSFSGVHFKTYVRRDETTWTLLDDLSHTTSQVDINGIRMDTFRPRLLMYVRVHPPEVEEQDQREGDKNTNSDDHKSTKDGTDAMDQPGLADVDMGPFTDDEDFEDESSGSDPPAKARDAPPAVEPPVVKGENTTEPAESTLRKSEAEVETQAERQIQIQSPETQTPPADVPLGPLEGDPNLYPPTKTLPPGRLMRIIRAAGYWRERPGRGLRRSLGGVRRSARVRIATRLAMSTNTAPRRITR